MGTHPIFESDFDCLTELKLYETCAARDYHSNMKGETKSVKRCLFGKARSPSTSQDQMQSDLELKNNEWNFDFNKEKPIGDKFFVWETVSANRAPKFYSKTPSKKNCNPNRSLRRKRRSYTSPGRDEALKNLKSTWTTIILSNRQKVEEMKTSNRYRKIRKKKLIKIKNSFHNTLEPNLDMLVKLL